MNLEGGKILILLVIFATAVLPLKVLAYDKNVAHRHYSRQIVDFYEAVSGQDVFSQKDIDLIVQGAIEEDEPVYIRSLNHFYDPIGGGGWEPKKVRGEFEFLSPEMKMAYTLFLPVSAKQWAQDSFAQNSSHIFGGDFSWQRAIQDYLKGDRERAMRGLGHILHLIQDVSVPAHVRLDTHLEGEDDDPFEKWNKYNVERLDVVSTLLKNNARFKRFADLNSAFDNIALFVAQRFVSQDAPEVKEFIGKLYAKRIIAPSGEHLVYVYNDYGDGEYPLFAVNAQGQVELKDNAINLNYYLKIAPEMIKVGAGVIDLFFDEVKKTKKEEAKNIHNVIDSALMKGAVGLSDASRAIIGGGFLYSRVDDLAENFLKLGVDYVTDKASALAQKILPQKVGARLEKITGPPKRKDAAKDIVPPHALKPAPPPTIISPQPLIQPNNTAKPLPSVPKAKEAPSSSGIPLELVDKLYKQINQLKNELKITKKQTTAHLPSAQAPMASGPVAPAPAVVGPSAPAPMKQASAPNYSVPTGNYSIAPSYTPPPVQPPTIIYIVTPTPTSSVSSQEPAITPVPTSTPPIATSTMPFATSTVPIATSTVPIATSTPQTETQPPIPMIQPVPAPRLLVDPLPDTNIWRIIVSLDTPVSATTLHEDEGEALQTTSTIITTPTTTLTTTLTPTIYYFDIEYSKDNGTIWEQLALSTTSTVLRFEAPTDGNYIFRARASASAGGAEAGSSVWVQAQPSGQFFTLPKTVVINEIAPHGTGQNNQNDEWIELYNTTGKTIQLDGWTLELMQAQINVNLSGAIKPYNYYLLEQGDDNVITNKGAQKIYTGLLDNFGDTLILRDPDGAIIDVVDQSDGWSFFREEPIDGYAFFRTLQRTFLDKGGSDLNNWHKVAGINKMIGQDRNGKDSFGTPLIANRPVREISGTITKDTVFTRNQGPYTMRQITVPKGVTVRFEEGVVVKVPSSSDAQMVVEPGGMLEIKGTELRPVIFTSKADELYDPSGGVDMGGYYIEYWRGITLIGAYDVGGPEFELLALDSLPHFTLENFKIHYGSGIVSAATDGMLTLRNVSVDLKNVDMQIGYRGIYAKNSVVKIDGGYFYNFSYPVIHLYGGRAEINNITCEHSSESCISTEFGANVELADSRFKYNRQYSSTIPIIVHNSSISAQRNTFIENSYNAISLQGTLSASMKLTKEHYWLVRGSLEVPKGMTLEIEPGAKVGFDGVLSVKDGGALIANGTAEEPIIFGNPSDPAKMPGFVFPAESSLRTYYFNSGSLTFASTTARSVLSNVHIVSSFYYGNFVGGEPVNVTFDNVFQDGKLFEYKKEGL